MHIASLLTSLTLASSRIFTIGFHLHTYSAPAAKSWGALSTGTGYRSSLSIPPTRHQRRAHDVMKMMKDSDAQTAVIHRYESPFFPINENQDQNYSSMSSALIILNTPIHKSPSIGNNDAPIQCKQNSALPGVIGALWKKSTYRVCADGGANRLYEATVLPTNQRDDDDDDNNGGGVDSVTRSYEDYLPDLITGDLDSLYPHVYEYYKSKGVEIIRVEDQDFHDFDKSLMAIEKWIGQKRVRNNDETNAGIINQSRVFIYGGFGGRFDQEMAVINALCVWGKKETFRQTTLAVYDEQTCAFLLSALPTTNHIRIRYSGNGLEKTHQPCGVGEGPTCGLIPILGRCEKVFTTGLQWNLNGDVPIEFGGLVSSSNRAIDDVVVIETSTPMLFTAEMIVSGV